MKTRVIFPGEILQQGDFVRSDRVGRGRGGASKRLAEVHPALYGNPVEPACLDFRRPIPALSRQQIFVLRAVRDGDPLRCCNSRSDYGGRSGTLQSLKRLKLITEDHKQITVTKLGEEWLREEDGPS